jgi:hypothetical protein
VRFSAIRPKRYDRRESGYAANIKFAPVVKAILQYRGVLPRAERLSPELSLALFVSKPCCELGRIL